MSVGEEGRGVRRRSVIISALGITQTLSWGSTYYLPAVFADRIAGDLHISREWFSRFFPVHCFCPGCSDLLPAARLISMAGEMC